MREDSITGWMFGFDPTNPGESIPSIAGEYFIFFNFIFYIFIFKANYIMVDQTQIYFTQSVKRSYYDQEWSI